MLNYVLSVNRVLQADVVKKIDDWVHNNKIQVQKRREWVELIHPLTDLFAIPKGKRKEPFSHYKETQIVKLKQPISAVEQAEKNYLMI